MSMTWTISKLMMAWIINNQMLWRSTKTSFHQKICIVKSRIFQTASLEMGTWHKMDFLALSICLLDWTKCYNMVWRHCAYCWDVVGWDTAQDDPRACDAEMQMRYHLLFVVSSQYLHWTLRTHLYTDYNESRCRLNSHIQISVSCSLDNLSIDSIIMELIEIQILSNTELGKKLEISKISSCLSS